MYKKIFAAFAFAFIVNLQAFAGELSSSINGILNSFDFDRDSVVSVSVKDKKTGLIAYEKNAYKFLNPASVLKLFTMAASIDALGSDFEFKTAFYKDKKGDLYLKLSGDPMLTDSDLNELASNLKKNHKGKINRIYIDDSVIDMVPYPDGWTVDDFWPNSPKLSPYMVDYNTVKIDIYLSEDKNNIRIIQKSPYRFSFVNKLTVSDTNSINFVNDEIHNTVNIEGTISSSITGREIPVINPKYFFCKKLNDALNKNGIVFHDKFLFAKTPNDAVSVAEFARPLETVVKHILTTSDNLAAEMVFKVAGAKYAEEKTPLKTGLNTFGTTQNGINMFFDYYEKLGLDIKQVKLRDGSGVSRYNAMNANWMTNALLKMNLDYEKYLPTSGEGTLLKRMREMKDSVYFKTGTLFGTSSLAGVIKSGDNEYYWASVIMSYNRNKSLIKGIEDEMVYEVYRAGENE